METELMLLLLLNGTQYATYEMRPYAGLKWSSTRYARGEVFTLSNVRGSSNYDWKRIHA